MKLINTKRSLVLFFISILIINAVLPLSVLAIDTNFFSGNDILFYNPDDDCDAGTANGGSYGTAPKTTNLKSFVDAYGQGAFDIGKKYGMPYEAILAQAMLESGYGKSKLTYKYYNFFGIKDGGTWDGETVTMGTNEEYTPGNITRINAAFRVYPTIEAGWEGYALFITNNGKPQRYKKALKYPGDYVNYLKEIATAGYATSKSYAKNTISLANAVADYVKAKNKWPPSSEVAKTNKPTGGSASTTAADSGCESDAAGATKIVDTALSFALDKPAEEGKQNKKSDANPAYIEAIKKYNPGASVADCGMFVATVMIASGADKSYPKQQTGTQLSYVKKTTSKYKIIENPKKADLEPGDILIVANGSDHHTMIYTGGNPYPAVDASQGTRVPSVREDGSLGWMLGTSGVIAARLIK